MKTEEIYQVANKIREVYYQQNCARTYCLSDSYILIALSVLNKKITELLLLDHFHRVN